jgi:hypothetical protein
MTTVVLLAYNPYDYASARTPTQLTPDREPRRPCSLAMNPTSPPCHGTHDLVAEFGDVDRIFHANGVSLGPVAYAATTARALPRPVWKRASP